MDQLFKPISFNNLLGSLDQFRSAGAVSTGVSKQGDEISDYALELHDPVLDFDCFTAAPEALVLRRYDALYCNKVTSGEVGVAEVGFEESDLFVALLEVGREFNGLTAPSRVSEFLIHLF